MSPIDFPDLLDSRRGTNGLKPTAERQSSKSRLLRSRSRSRTPRTRSSSVSKRRAASCQPTERRSSRRDASTSSAKRRSHSRPVSRNNKREDRRSSSGSRRAAEISELRDSSAAWAQKKKSSNNTKHNMRTPSPSKRHTGRSKTSRNPREIINLVDHDDEDRLLNNLLLEDSPTADNSGGKMAVASPSPKSVARFPDQAEMESNNYSDDDDDDADDEDESEEEESENEEEEEIDTRALLSQAKGRMEQQRLMEEVHELKRALEKKNAEIDQLTGQLRMAISTKCDLVIAHTELERTHEMDLKQRDQYAEEMKKTNLRMIELRAEIEREFMNELTSLATQVDEAEKRRVADLAEKDEEVEALNAKIRKMEQNMAKGRSARPESDKVKYYKKKLGMSEDEYSY